MQHPPDYFISCDWGTTNFRLRVVAIATLGVAAEQATDQGIRDTYDLFRGSGEGDQYAYFADYLFSQVERLPVEYHACPVVASGMASARIGLKELPYARLPIGSEGKFLVTEWLEGKGKRQLLLISGVSDSDNIMRGEEVQALGLIPFLREYGDGTLILPGTHSKHLRYLSGAFISFDTYLTGELFEVLSRRTILANSVLQGPLDAAGVAAFREGVALGAAGKLSRSLFSVRVRDVLNAVPLIENYYFLSGLLLGEELRDLPGRRGMVYLAAPEPVLTLYRIALEALLEPDRLVCYNGVTLQRAQLYGQLKLLLRHD